MVEAVPGAIEKAIVADCDVQADQMLDQPREGGGNNFMMRPLVGDNASEHRSNCSVVSSRTFSEKSFTSSAAGWTSDSGRSSCRQEYSNATSVAMKRLAAISHSSNRGDEEAICTILSHLHDPNSEVRTTAVLLLARAVNMGDDRAITAFEAAMKDPDVTVREAAVQACAQVAHPGDTRVGAAMCACLEDVDARMRTAALMTLLRFTEKGQEDVVNAVERRLEDESSRVRCAAVITYARAVTIHERAFEMMRLRLADLDARVRRLAVIALTEVAEKGDLSAIEAIGLCTEDLDADVRQSAIAALKHKSKGNASSTDSVAFPIAVSFEMATQTAAKVEEGEINPTHPHSRLSL
mmetsp:Transcript_67617/g.188696  ORF Transcript_67617/g.188696 Transcript_67617/m.188696 type:complete len:352 (-) Transcript_67617:226-1281(-)|eukprot:CAMPEP_0117581488 /NCGR_PEP_ID=MMETSP0784-20121206/65857_1 /TAXON_ID=39447 /ORGANISM="" /LENGTH=351 /DNA_ID=CAMNT_0005381809 /DNA_START=42 /DNA_END=1097 /DNA_ORIENTATION=+